MALARPEIAAAICAALAGIIGQRNIGADTRVIEDLDDDSINFATLLIWRVGQHGVTWIVIAADSMRSLKPRPRGQPDRPRGKES